MHEKKNETHEARPLDAAQALLWAKIRDFAFDEPGTRLPFEEKLAHRLSWPVAFAREVITEYRKFMLLCAILPQGASPPPAVDEAWHLHLTYTVNYWERFCRETVGQPIHHHPSKGGPEAAARHRAWYADTVAAYETIFGNPPPPHIWPPPAGHQNSSPATGIQYADRYYRQSILLLLLAPLLPILVLYGTLQPFSLAGPHFLIYFIALTLSALGILLLNYWRFREKIFRFLDSAPVPEDLTLFQLSWFAEGHHKTTQLCLLDLMDRQVITFGEDQQFSFTPKASPPAVPDQNPLYPALLLSMPQGGTFSYTSAFWQLQSLMSHHPFLECLAAQAPPAFLSGLIYGLTIAIGAVRVLQGWHYGKPTGHLIALMLFFTLFSWLLGKSFSFKNQIRQYLADNWSHRVPEKNTLLGDYYFEGAAALSTLPMIGLAATYFTAFRDLQPYERNQQFWDSCGSSDGGDGGGDGGGCGGCGGCGGGD